LTTTWWWTTPSRIANSHEYYKRQSLTANRRAFFTAGSWCVPTRRKPIAKQTNKNLLLSDDATIDTKPQLEIYADRCEMHHGATIGQLNDESIFYLRARGHRVGKKPGRC